MSSVGHSVRFGDFEADLGSRELRRGGVKVKLQEQPFQLLACLVERPGEIVTREELRERLWPDEFVDFDHSLNAAVRKLREGLGDAADTPRFIETLSRRGYRFIAAVTHDDAPRRRGWLWIAAALLAIGVTAGFAFVRRAPAPRTAAIKAIAVLPFTAEAENEVADRMTESVIDSLSAGVPEVRVMARASVFGFQGTKLDPWKVGSLLHCDAVVLGRITRDRDAYRVRVEMIEVRTGAELWGDGFQAKSPAELSTLISESVARQLRKQS